MPEHLYTLYDLAGTYRDMYRHGVLSRISATALDFAFTCAVAGDHEMRELFELWFAEPHHPRTVDIIADMRRLVEADPDWVGSAS